jgi:hypothetical protein
MASLNRFSVRLRGRVDADPDPAFHRDADPGPAFHMMRIGIRFPRMMRIHVDPDLG